MRGAGVEEVSELCDICQRPILGEVFSPGKCHKACIEQEMGGVINDEDM